MKHLSLPEVIVNHINRYIPDYDHASMCKSLRLVSHQSFYNRAGPDVLPFRFDTEFYQKFCMPQIDQNFSKTFTEITDQRCYELISQYSQKPWIVQWSGGIDSTVILVSLLKNLSKEQLSNITVSCNAISVFENPLFFRNHVLKNFKTTNSTDLHIEEKFNDYYIIDGNPADLLFSGGLGLNAKNSGLDLSKSWRNSADKLINFLTYYADSNVAKWLYTHMEANLASNNEHCQVVETLADWCWWINFNWKWIGDCWHGLDAQRLKNTQLYHNSYINWFNNTDYQQWSISCGRYSLIKDGPCAGDYKKSSKQYIHDFDHNDYYLNFKTKGHSTAQMQQPQSWICMLDDLSTLTVEDDLDLILELLSTHLNIK